MRYLFITKDFPPVQDVSGYIVSDLADALCKRGDCVDVITRQYEGGDHVTKKGSVYYVHRSYWEKLSEKRNKKNASKILRLWYWLFSLLRKVYLAFHIYQFPDSEISITRRIIRLYKKLIGAGKTYDCVVGFFRPYSCIHAISLIKAFHPQVVSVAYVFDLVDSKSRPSFMPQKLYNLLIRAGDIKMCECNDWVILPCSVKNRQYSVFSDYQHKTVFCEFPSYKEKSLTSPCPEKISDNYVFVFAGTMDRNYRNPINMLNAFSQMALFDDGNNYCLHIYGGGDCAEVIASFKSPRNMKIKYHGKVDKSEVSEAEQMADFLVNITNMYDAIVPSKIFGLFSSCKPIINIWTHEDGSAPYFEKYKLYHSVDCSDKTLSTEQLYNFSRFLKNSRGRLLDPVVIKNRFIENSPEFVAETLADLVMRSCES